MTREQIEQSNPVTIETGPASWQVLQQDAKGVAKLRLSGRWWTVQERKKPEVRVRVAYEGRFTAISRAHDWVGARTTVDRTVTGDMAGRCGTWELTLADIPCGGPYRIETTVGGGGDAVEWRRSGQVIHFLCVGDVWLIAGQSNAEGYGRDPVDDPSEIGVHHFDEDGWHLAAHGRNHHPWLAFAKTLKKELGHPIGLVPTAVGGTPVLRWAPGPKGDLFDRMTGRLEGAGSNIRGCLWYQGESDTGETDHPKYKVRFTRFVQGLRRAVKHPSLPIITVQLNRVLPSRNQGTGWEAMREIQRQLSHELEGVFVIPIFEAGLCDGIHISSQSNLLLAERAATTALGGVYGRDILYLHPECVAARRISGRTIELRFENVAERLDYECALDNNGFPFSVRDEKGEVPVAGYALPRKNVFRIRLQRALSGSASVTGAPGTCPPQIVPRDINGYRCMLGFTREIE